MLDQGYIDQAAYDEAMADDVYMQESRLSIHRLVRILLIPIL